MPNIIEITDFHAPELDPYARLTQNQLRNRLEPEKGIFIAESPKVIDRALDAGYKPVSLLMERKQITGPAAGILSRCGDAPVYTADREMLAELTGFELTRGVLCAFHRPAPRPVEELCKNARRVAVLAQASRPPAMTVEALVACGRNPYQAHQGKLSREDREHVERALELAGIARFRTQELRRLSGGERQRAFIAMTLAQDTDLIVLDEPTTYLDIRACHETMELVRRLNVEAGKTVVMVIHDLDLALRYSDCLLVMERGRATASGTVAEVLATGAIERAFGVSIRTCATPEGTAYTLFPA